MGLGVFGFKASGFYGLGLGDVSRGLKRLDRCYFMFGWCCKICVGFSCVVRLYTLSRTCCSPYLPLTSFAKLLLARRNSPSELQTAAWRFVSEPSVQAKNWRSQSVVRPPQGLRGRRTSFLCPTALNHPKTS